MLEGLRRSQRWVLAILIVALGLTFVFFLAVGGGSGFGSQGSAAVAVRVGKRQFDWRDVDRIRQRQIDEYRRTLGDAFDPSAAEQYLEQMAASALVESALLAREGERMGLRVGEGEMRAFLRSVPGGTTADGRIDREAWTAHAEREYGSVSRFEDALRDDLLARRCGRRPAWTTPRSTRCSRRTPRGCGPPTTSARPSSTSPSRCALATS
jgi:hypothetical protein